MTSLTESELRAIDELGYAVVPGFLTHDQVERLRREIDELGPRMWAATPPGVEVQWEEAPAAAPRIRQLLHAELVSEEIARLLSSRVVTDALEPLLGPDVDLFEVKVLAKAERVGGAIPWHQDFPYWRHRLREPLVVSCMIYLDDADAENGCLEVIPGSHRSGALDHRAHHGDAFNRSLSRPLDGGRERLVGSAGTAIFFPPLLAHASSPNTSARPRRAFTAVFTAAGNGISRATIHRGSDDAEIERWLAFDRVARVSGPGPHGGQCAAHYRRREIWKLAFARIADRSRAWVQIGCGETGALEWWSGRKPPGTALYRVDPLSSDAKLRAEVELLPSFGAAMARLGDADVGCLHLESGYYASAARVFSALGRALAPGAVIICDRLHGFDGWKRQASLALRELALREGLAFELIARADTALALRVAARGVLPRIEVAPAPAAVSQGLSLETGDLAPPTGSSLVRRTRASARRFRDRLAREIRRRLSSDYALFPELEIPRFEGDGDPNGDCPTHARRRALWRYALSLVDDPRRPWVEFGVGEGESLDWFAAHKPAETPLLAFDSFEGIPEPWLGHPAGQWQSAPYVSHRPDVRVVNGLFDESLARADIRAALGPCLGFVHVDCDLYSSTHAVLEGISASIGPGTVIVFDELYGYPGWARHEARALFEFCRERRLEIEWLARSDTQAALRVRAVGSGPRASVRAVDRTASWGTGIQLGFEPSLAWWAWGRGNRFARRAIRR